MHNIKSKNKGVVWLMRAILKGVGMLMLPVLVMASSLALSPTTAGAAPAQAAPVVEHSPEELTTMATYLQQTRFPHLSVEMLAMYLTNPKLVEYFFGVTSIHYENPVIADAPSLSSSSLNMLDNNPCRTATTRAYARGIFGTLFSFRVTMGWCYSGNVVYNITKQFFPDVTSYGAAFGWKYTGQWRSVNQHWYNYSGLNPYSGYVYQVFGQFERCMLKLGCVDQRFTSVGVRGHHVGTYTLIHKLW